MKTIIFITAFMLIFAVYTIELPLEQPWLYLTKGLVILIIVGISGKNIQEVV